MLETLQPEQAGGIEPGPQVRRLQPQDREFSQLANCGDLATRLFYPTNSLLDKRVKAACRDCPIRPDCAEWGDTARALWLLGRLVCESEN